MVYYEAQNIIPEPSWVRTVFGNVCYYCLTVGASTLFHTQARVISPRFFSALAQSRLNLGLASD